ncbi:hypothetical protein QQ045_012728 [Rhodiola kirilowii]
MVNAVSSPMAVHDFLQQTVRKKHPHTTKKTPFPTSSAPSLHTRIFPSPPAMMPGENNKEEPTAAAVAPVFMETDSIPSSKYPMHSDPNLSMNSFQSEDDFMMRKSNASAYMSPAFYDPTRMSTEGSPMMMSPWNQSSSPFATPSWSYTEESQPAPATLAGSLVREEGHIYSLAAKGDLLYTGSDSKNIRVWKNLKEFSAFKSNSGLVKAIVISGEKIFSGHQDGKIRVWRISQKNPAQHRRSSTLPTLKEIFKASIRPRNYVMGRKNKSGLWIKHSDAISCLSLCEELGLLYSASWDRTFKVWRIADSKCLESINAHNDAVNAVVTGHDDTVYTGSADGSVKVWKRKMQGKITSHEFVKTLQTQECAVTAVAISPSGMIIYSGSSDGMVSFWDNGKKEMVHGGVLKGHKLAIMCIVTAGNLMFSGSADNTICIWKCEGTVHTCLSVLTGHNGPVKCLTVEKDAAEGNGGEKRWKLYSGSLDKSVKVWNVCDRPAVAAGEVGPPRSWDSVPSERSLSSSQGHQ